MGDGRNKCYQYSVDSWSHFAKKNNCELLVWEDLLCPVEQMKITWQRYYMFDILESNNIDYDQILIVDADTIVHPNCPNFFEFSEHKFCGVSAVGSMDWICRSLENYSSQLFDGFMFPYWKYINSGFMIMNGKHKKLFKDILDFYFTNKDKILWMQNNMGVGTDQPVVNFFLNKENVECKLLPYEYNMQDMTRFEVLGEDMLHTKYGWVYHFNAGVKPSPGVWLEHTYKYLMK